MSQVVVGMAGHIDHGKTSLVQALTGIDTDSLIEEKKRGMTIDLGFAYLGDMITIIDVPGHEKFIRNMVAGAASTHLALIVIAADDGIMPQTLEHLEILTSLGITKGIVALSKIDLVKDLEWIELV
jgi:selenocysteine-specific elongation factor